MSVQIKANLGLATTRELLDELRARIDVDYSSGGGGLDYTTVGGRPDSRYPLPTTAEPLPSCWCGKSRDEVEDITGPEPVARREHKHGFGACPVENCRWNRFQDSTG